MRSLVFLLLALPLAAAAQALDPQDVNDRMKALYDQRNAAMDQAAMFAAELAKTQRALETAKKAADSCKPDEKK